MLQNVRHFWIKGVLEQSLYVVARLELGLTTQPDAVEDVWNVLVQRPEQTPQPLPPGTRLSTIFDEFGPTLLILGAPGTGKTTLLLELTKDLLARAEQDPNYPIPTVFNLSSWAARQPPLADWLVDELSARYQVPRKHAQSWIDKDLILPLLDGLDEVASACRSACVETINAFSQQHGSVSMAVCSRLADYKALTVKLRLQEALVVQSLTHQQIDHYLTQAGEPLAGVRVALQDDETLWELLDTPLMLSITALAYQWRLAAEMQTVGTLAERRTHLFAAYVDAMFKRRGKAAPYSRQQTVRWLVWLATAMARQNQSVFHLEWVQPDWLPERIHHWLVSHGTVLRVLVFGLFCGLVGMPVGGLVYGLVGVPVVGLVIGLVNGLFFGLSGGLVGVLVHGRLASDREYWRIKPAETLTWRWSLFKEYLVSESFVLLSAGLFFGLSVGLFFGLVNGLVALLVFWLVPGLVPGLVAGLVTGEITTHSRPNEGMRRSWHNALLSGLLVGPVVGLFFGLVNGLVYGLTTGLVAGLVGGLFVGLLSGLEKGGYAYFQHLILRFLLWRNNYAPWHYVRFLDYAAERVFLRKVGGGYVFIHRMLLEYFATLYPSKSEPKGEAS